MSETEAGRAGAEVERLWARGDDDDDRAIEALLAGAPAPGRPAFLRGPGATTLHPWAARERIEEALPLLREQYWNLGRFDDRAITRAHAHSSAWVVARDDAGAMVATARAVSDRVKYAYVGDVAVHAAWRGRGVGHALLTMMLAHPCLRDVARVELGTRDAMGFYERLGFARAASSTNGPYTRWTMALVRK